MKKELLIEMRTMLKHNKKLIKIHTDNNQFNLNERFCAITWNDTKEFVTAERANQYDVSDTNQRRLFPLEMIMLPYDRIIALSAEQNKNEFIEVNKNVLPAESKFVPTQEAEVISKYCLTDESFIDRDPRVILGKPTDEEIQIANRPPVVPTP